MARRAKGEGSLYQAKDKSWIYQYIVNGKRKTKRFRRKSDANLFIRQLATEDGTDEAENGQPVEQTSLPMPTPVPVQEKMKKGKQKTTEPEVTVGRISSSGASGRLGSRTRISTPCGTLSPPDLWNRVWTS